VPGSVVVPAAVLGIVVPAGPHLILDHEIAHGRATPAVKCGILDQPGYRLHSVVQRRLPVTGMVEVAHDVAEAVDAIDGVQPRGLGAGRSREDPGEAMKN